MQVKVLEKAVETALDKLNKLKVDAQLRAELEWCLGSYQFDQNPSGLLEKSQAALSVLKEEKEKNSRAVSKKIIDDLEKVLD